MYFFRPVLISLTLLSILTFSITGRAAVRSDTCSLTQLTAALDGQDGKFDGMSQSGTLLVLHNSGHIACVMSPLPTLTFEDTRQQPLAVERRIPHGMHPGPVLMPVVIAPGKNVATRLRWVASDVFDAGNCVRPAFVSLNLAGGSLTVPFDRQMCAAKGQTSFYSQSLTGTP